MDLTFPNSNIAVISNNTITFPNIDINSDRKNTIIGINAPTGNNIIDSVLIGDSAGIHSRHRDGICIGNGAGWNSTSQLSNEDVSERSIFIGTNSGQQAFGSSDSIGIGVSSLKNRQGASNIAIGTDAGGTSYSAHDESLYSTYNIYIGRNAGNHHSPSSKNIFIRHLLCLRRSSEYSNGKYFSDIVFPTCKHVQ